MHCSNQPHLFDHLVGAGQQRERDGDAERIGGPEINDQLDFVAC
jgi:hypothetical protein